MVVPFRKAIRRNRSVAGLCAGVVLVSGLAGCSFLEDRSQRYVYEPEGEALKTVDERQRDRIGTAYPVRDIQGGEVGRMYTEDLPEPPDMTSEILEQNYLVEVLDDQTWLLVNELPGQVWPNVTAYLNSRSLGVAFDNPQLGLVQSDLVNYSRQARDLVGLPAGSGPESLVIVQARVSPGVRRKTTEIQLRPRTVQGRPDGLVPWQSVTEGLETEKALLQDLAVFLKSREETKSYSRAALGMTSEPLVRLVTEDDFPIAIRMDLDFDRAWSEVRRALEEANVAVVDLNRSGGQFYVDYRSSDERDPGLFSWFTDDPEPEYTFDVKLVQQDGFIVVSTDRAPEYTGSDRSTLLLSELFEYLY